MRISSTQYHATMDNALQNASARLEKVMQQMASGQRLLLPSDDPVTNVRLSRMTREDAALTQYRDNISALASRLTKNETSLQSMVQDMLAARDLVVWASDGTNTAEDGQAMANSLVSLRDSLFYTSNSRDQEGNYLFSGTASSTPAITFTAAPAAGTRYSATGNTNVQQVAVGNGISQGANVALSTDVSDMLNLLDRTIEALQAGASANDPVVRALLGNTLDGPGGLDDALASLNGKIAGLGGAQNILETLDSNHSNVSVSNKQAMITLGQLDYGEAATRLAGYTTALQATQKAYGKVSGLSLFDVL